MINICVHLSNRQTTATNPTIITIYCDGSAEVTNKKQTQIEQVRKFQTEVPDWAVPRAWCYLSQLNILLYRQIRICTRTYNLTHLTCNEKIVSHLSHIVFGIQVKYRYLSIIRKGDYIRNKETWVVRRITSMINNIIYMYFIRTATPLSHKNNKPFFSHFQWI